MVAGQHVACRNLASYSSQCGGGVKVPSSTFENSLFRLVLPKQSSKGDVRKGVWWACVKQYPASCRHAFLSSVFMVLLLLDRVARSNDVCKWTVFGLCMQCPVHHICCFLNPFHSMQLCPQSMFRMIPLFLVMTKLKPVHQISVQFYGRKIRLKVTMAVA